MAVNKADKYACPCELTFLQQRKGKQTNSKMTNKKILYCVCKCFGEKIVQNKGDRSPWEENTFS